MHGGVDWQEELYRDYVGPIIIHDDNGNRSGLLANFGMIPKRHLPPKTDYSTMNARDDTVDQLRSYKKSWTEGKFCLVPMNFFYEPNWESDKHVRWKIGMANSCPFAVAGIYREWIESDDQLSFSFTQLTINADQHPLMQRFHRKGEEKRSLVIVQNREYDDWLSCRSSELAKTYLQPFPAELMAAEPAPKPAKLKKANPENDEKNLSLF